MKFVSKKFFSLIDSTKCNLRRELKIKIKKEEKTKIKKMKIHIISNFL